MSPQLLLPDTALPSGWSIDPVTGHCVRISDGAQFGRATSAAIAWSTRDLEARLPAAAGPDADFARLCNAVGWALVDRPFTGDDRQDQATVDAIHAAGGRFSGAGGTWQWEAGDGLDAGFNERLGCLLDAIGVERARCPDADGVDGNTWLLTGRIGAIAVRCAQVVHGDGRVQARLLAQRCADAGAATQRAREWAIDAVRQHLAASAATAIAFLHRIPFHGDDAACLRIAHALERMLAECGAPAEDARAIRSRSPHAAA